MKGSTLLLLIFVGSARLCVRERANARTCSLQYAPVQSSWLGCSSALLILCLLCVTECSLHSSTLIYLLFSSVLSYINIRRPFIINRVGIWKTEHPSNKNEAEGYSITIPRFFNLLVCCCIQLTTPVSPFYKLSCFWYISAFLVNYFWCISAFFINWLLLIIDCKLFLIYLSLLYKLLLIIDRTVCSVVV